MGTSTAWKGASHPKAAWQTCTSSNEDPFSMRDKPPPSEPQPGRTLTNLMLIQDPDQGVKLPTHHP